MFFERAFKISFPEGNRKWKQVEILRSVGQVLRKRTSDDVVSPLGLIAVGVFSTLGLKRQKEAIHAERGKGLHIEGVYIGRRKPVSESAVKRRHVSTLTYSETHAIAPR